MKPRRFYMNLHATDDPHPRAIREVRVGDLLIGPNVAYVVTDCWPTETRSAANRWTITARRVGERPRSFDSWAQLRLLYPGAREIVYQCSTR